MIDREKVINGLECMKRKSLPTDEECSSCGYYNSSDCGLDVSNDALALLKEHEPLLIVRKWHKSELGDYSRLHCPKCDNEIEKPTFLERNEASYCPYCGQLVKWK